MDWRGKDPSRSTDSALSAIAVVQILSSADSQVSDVVFIVLAAAGHKPRSEGNRACYESAAGVPGPVTPSLF
jgi:hypothetical protein